MEYVSKFLDFLTKSKMAARNPKITSPMDSEPPKTYITTTIKAWFLWFLKIKMAAKTEKNVKNARKNLFFQILTSALCCHNESLQFSSIKINLKFLSQKTYMPL